jgi:putative redox protein
MEVTIKTLGDVKFEASARGHRVLTDQPAVSGGEDAGMTPPELMLAALGTCAGHYAVQYLRTRSLPTEGVEVKVVAEKLLKPARLANFRIEVDAPAIPPEHEAGLLRAVKACLIHNTMLEAPAIQTVVRTAVPA